jgi:hypothetical protein
LIETEAYKPRFGYQNEDDDFQDAGVRIMAICYSSDKTEASFTVIIDENGVVLDHQRLVNFTRRLNSRFPDEVLLKVIQRPNFPICNKYSSFSNYLF